ncbi:hypothetical protein [Pseudomonas viridiflava]|uniref:hypothetical protein n=1 Tax=Pseudomonas viridiflava TaxID=33069 RepID=UPI000F0300EA|nr:hypothetical protein [Pseudomonas viridiflava]MEE3929645.1 hypothetical protein [Pseudomonas viridiflava]MEE3980838.1 hypothetical protein [Pseudomonas viridiflava]MEE3989572.1 hypothetical protein [Pseudomonas viridiflava]MEE4028118.1 hypothetical protein [Pseudomonas viridiflava]MEE4034282.1 hypothetical protein [Pseudomonas viridiflava]
MQSHNYVPGVSGWKMHSNGTLEVEGKVRAIMVEQAETPELPFAIEGDQVFLSQAFVDDSKLSSDWSLKVSTNAAGQLFCSGFGVGIDKAPVEKESFTFGDAQEKVAVTIGGVQYINRSLIKGEAARLVADEIIAACSAAKQ